MKTLLFLCFSILSLNVTAQSKQPTAEEILAPAYTQAKKEKKKVFIIFHASWCGWCRKMDASMNDPLVSKYFTDNYVTVHLAVDESENKKHLENEGAKELKNKYKGQNAGLPFWLIMDENRNLLADSYMRKSGIPLSEPGDNIGCPAAAHEVKAFITALKITSGLSTDALKIIETHFRKNEL